MKTLVFALIFETLIDGYVEKSEQFGFFEDVNHCIYFARKLTLQGGTQYEIPHKSYCIPKYVDAKTTVIFKR